MSEALAAAPATETTLPAKTEAAPAASTLLTTPASQNGGETVAPAGSPIIPEKYEFAAPVIDGKPLEVDPAALGSFETAAREAGMTQEQFAKIAPLGAQMIAAKVREAIGAAMPEHLQPATQDAWIAGIKADAEIGGAKLQGSLANAAKAIDHFGGAELRQALDLTRAGNNPAIVKFFAKVGAAMGDAGKLLTGAPAAGAKPQTREQAARDFYNTAGGSYPPVET